MASETVSDPTSGSATSRGKKGLALLMFGVFGAPLAFATQELVNYVLASYACYPNLTPRDTPLPGWGWLWPVLLVISILMLVVAVAAGWTAYRQWRAFSDEQPGSHHHVLEVGERWTGFLALSGIITGLLFSATLVFSSVELFIVPLCGG